MPRYIAISGTIGAGKTELAKKLAEKYQGRLILEEFAHNSFLAGFYKEPDRYAFPLEISFLFERFQQLNVEFSKPDLFTETYISDYFFDKSLLFGRINLKPDQFNVFNTLFKAFREQVHLPGLIIYLHRPVECLMENIRKRGRSFEKEIRSEYLVKLQDAYFSYFKTLSDIPVVILQMKELDFIKDDGLIEKIYAISRQSYNFGLNIITL